jgi:hypothetical protein
VVAAGPAVPSHERHPVDRSAELSWIQSLISEFPGIEPVYEDHVRDFDELLPHLLFGDVVRWVERLYEAGDHSTIKAFVARMESDYPTLDPACRNLVDVSFAEDLPYPGTRGAEIALWLGPNLRREYERGHHLEKWARQAFGDPEAEGGAGARPPSRGGGGFRNRWRGRLGRPG